jgi:hypothetical protein
MPSMNPIRTTALACILALIHLTGTAQQATAPTAKADAAKPEGAKNAVEPNVKTIVIEDDGARIEELRVRGETQRIVVSPKRGSTAPYEIVTADGWRDLGDGANTSRGAAGKRVWNVLKF